MFPCKWHQWLKGLHVRTTFTKIGNHKGEVHNWRVSIFWVFSQVIERNNVEIKIFNNNCKQIFQGWPGMWGPLGPHYAPSRIQPHCYASLFFLFGPLNCCFWFGHLVPIRLFLMDEIELRGPSKVKTSHTLLPKKKHICMIVYEVFPCYQHINSKEYSIWAKWCLINCFC